MPLWKRKKPPRLIVIGLDGTPYTLLRRLIDEGRLPHIAQLAEKADLRRIHSVYPTVSSVAWTTYMTGVNPARHGIFGFIDRKPHSYDTTIPTSRRIQPPTVWERLSEQDKRVIVLNVPVTFPPRPVNGILVGGFLSPSLEKAVYPPEKLPLFQQLNYQIDADPWLARQDRDRFLDHLEEVLDRRATTALHLLDHEPWDFFQCHIMETDRLYHFLWEQAEQGDPTYAPRFYAILERIDAFIGEVTRRADRTGAELLILSDHGFCTLKYEVYVNHWLHQKGWLTLPDPLPERVRLADIGPTSRAYSLDPGRIFINLKGREPNGTVDPADYESFRETIAQAALDELRDPQTGEPMLERVLRREEIYSGPLLDQAADLILVPRNGYDLKGAFGKPTLTFKGDALVGMHTYDDAFLLIRNHPLPQHDDIGIIDVTPTLFQLLNLPIPPDLEGRPLL